MEHANTVRPVRDLAVDFYRVSGVVLIVLGHWLAGCVTYHDGHFGRQNPLVDQGSGNAPVLPRCLPVGGVTDADCDCCITPLGVLMPVALAAAVVMVDAVSVSSACSLKSQALFLAASD